MRIEIFKTGKQTDSAGNTKDWTEADLDTIAAKYDPKNHEAPVCIGHPKDNAPAWGWVKSVTREGASLYAEIGDLVTEFSDMLKKKMFKKRSISLYPDLSLRHIGFLGAQPPAVKGLEDFAFSDAAGAPVEFMDWQTSWGFQSFGRIAQGLRDWFIETKDVATADRLLPQFEIDTLKNMQPDPDCDSQPAGYTEHSNEDPDMDKVKELETQVADFSQKLAAHATTITTLTTRAEAAEAKVAALEKDKLRGDLASFADRMVTAGKLLPALKANTIAIMESMAGQGEMEFTEGEGAAAKVVKKTPLKVYQDTLEAGPAVIHFGEFAKNGVAASEVPASNETGPASKKLSDLTDAKLKEDKSLTYQEASKAVLQENPDLSQAYALEMA